MMERVILAAVLVLTVHSASVQLKDVQADSATCALCKAGVAEILYLYLYLIHLYPGFYSYNEGATWKILDLLTETLLIEPSITVSWSFG